MHFIMNSKQLWGLFHLIVPQMNMRFSQMIFPVVVWMLLQGCMMKSFDKEIITSRIRVNQEGYLIDGKKQAVIIEPQEESFQIVDQESNVVFEGKILPGKYWDKSNEIVSVADFSAFSNAGIYSLVHGTDTSFTFTISENPYLELIKGASKSYYYNRASYALEKQYSGDYARSLSHPDTIVFIHATAASSKRPAGSTISTPYGWFDAGDYNKYVVNSGISLYTLMLAYEQNQELFDTLKWNIPESSNDRADLLDEIYWNIKWMETMQDPEDGGVYHKTTTARFEGFVKPALATSKRFVTAKSTAATLDYAATLAKYANLTRKSDQFYAELLLEKAKRAFEWAKNNPHVRYKNPTGLSQDPAILTGEYGDHEFSDEFFWAATELFLATDDKQYLNYMDIEKVNHFGVPNWASVGTLGLISMMFTEVELDVKLKKEACDRLKKLAEKLATTWMESPYRITLNEFMWGSNAVILNQGMVLCSAYRMFGNKEFYEAAQSSIDYVLGKNAVNYCFVTGFGSKNPKNIHHRPSAADNIDEPIPGLLAGGPNPRNMKEDCGPDRYPVHTPAKCYIDELCSYSTNEVAINWNAPLVYVASTISTLYQKDFK